MSPITLRLPVITPSPLFKVSQQKWSKVTPNCVQLQANFLCDYIARFYNNPAFLGQPQGTLKTNYPHYLTQL